MSQPIQPRCVVVVEPMSKVMEEIEAQQKESSKKKITKDVEEQTNGSPQVVINGKESKKENLTTTIGKSSKKEKKTEKVEQPASEAPVKNGASDVMLNTPVDKSTDKGNVATEAPKVPPTEETPTQNLEPDNDELFPELNYEDTSDNECNFDSSSPEFSPVGMARSVTRRSQAKKVSTPETPLQANSSVTPDVDEAVRSSNTPERSTPLREKVLRMRDSPLRSSPAPESKKRGSESPSVDNEDADSKNGSVTPTENGKTETNFSKTRIKVSPYRRSSRLSDQYSTVANYSGNNTTQQADITNDISSSSRDGSPTTVEEENTSDTIQTEKSFTDSYRHITSRRSYKHLREISLRNLAAQRRKVTNDTQKDESMSSVNATIDSQSTCDSLSSESCNSGKWTPIGHVIGRKRRQDEENEEEASTSHLPVHAESPALILDSEDEKTEQPASKRMRLLGYVTSPLGYVASPLRHIRDRMSSSTPIIHKPSIKHWQPEDPLVAPSSSGDVSVADEAMETPQVADIVSPLNVRTPQEGHKWCSIM